MNSLGDFFKDFVSQMPWIGKIVGGLVAYLLTLGMMGASRLFIIGLGVAWGHQFDKARARAANGAGFVGGSSQVQQVFFRSTFLVMGHLAKADGRVSEEEIRAARSVMHRLRLGPEQVKEAISLFSEGKSADFDLDAQVSKLRSASGGQKLLTRSFLEIQFYLLLSKGSIDAAERDSLWRIASGLGISRVELAQLEAILRAQRSFGGGNANNSTNPQRDIGQAYKALGIEPGISDKEVKTAYRRLMNQHHPDKLMAKGLPDSMLEVAKEKTREIRAAYEVIKESRGFK
ncbi:MAG: co-chaperone DjlA [Gammaproteobacteria bacterium]|nr:co-chaperone DjlA [Gammaproteobacteria bacterium]